MLLLHVLSLVTLENVPYPSGSLVWKVEITFMQIEKNINTSLFHGAGMWCYSAEGS